jgi:hypothetical protein
MHTVVKRAALAIACLLISQTAWAQATRTWVSGVGDDANPCSRTAPCKTFAGAISKTANKGEISVLDPGGYGSLSITKSITISGEGTLAGILSANTNGIIVNANPNDRVVIRNISIEGAGTGVNAVRLLKAAQLSLENVTMAGFTQVGVDVSVATNSALFLKNCTINGGVAGVKAYGSAGDLAVLLDHVTIRGATTGVHALHGTTTLLNSQILQSALHGVRAENDASVNILSSALIGNATALLADSATSIIRLSNNDIVSNGLGFGTGAGQIGTAGNNRRGGNGTGASASTFIMY